MIEFVEAVNAMERETMGFCIFMGVMAGFIIVAIISAIRNLIQSLRD